MNDLLRRKVPPALVIPRPPHDDVGPITQIGFSPVVSVFGPGDTEDCILRKTGEIIEDNLPPFFVREGFDGMEKPAYQEPVYLNEGFESLDVGEFVAIPTLPIE